MAERIFDSGCRGWRPNQLPELSGATYVITGGNSGIGFEAARMLGEAGGNVVLACRSMEKARAAASALVKRTKGTVGVVELDLSDLASVRSAAEVVRRDHPPIDGLINNAGVMQTPKRKTNDGFELQFGTNHLGHFLWTSRLMDRVEAAAGRVVVVSSIAHRFARIHFDDLMLERSYVPSKAYFQSKLANLMFAFELDRRLEAEGCKAICVACHPGYAATRLQYTGPGAVLNVVYLFTNLLLAQSAAAGAAPTVLAAAGREARRGGYYGPQRLGEARGPVGDAVVADHALDRDAARRLWEVSEDLVGEAFRLPGW